MAKLVHKHQPGLAGADKKFTHEFFAPLVLPILVQQNDCSHGGGFQFKDLFNSVFTFTGERRYEEDDY